MQAKYKVALALAAGFTLGAGAIQALHAQAKPSYVIGMINVKDEEGYKSNFLKEAQKQIANHGGLRCRWLQQDDGVHWLAA
jgi:ABC-type sugar transport system substrate-binding protein